MRIALNPPYYHQEDGGILIPEPAPKYRWIRKLSFIIELALGYIVAFIVIGLLNGGAFTLHILTQFYGSFLTDKPLLIVGKIISALILFLAAPFYLGLSVTRILTNFADNYGDILNRLEEYTFTGIIGLIGFGLLTISFVIKLFR